MYFEGLQLTDRGNWLPADETDDLTARKANGTTASLINAILRLCYNRRAPETETFRIFAASLTVRSSDSTDLSSVDWSIDRRFCQRIVFKLLLLASLFGLAISFNVAHSTAKCNGEVFSVEENLARSSIAEYLSGTRVEFILDPLDLGIRHNREI
jgi:hypothetical protein